MMRGEDGFPFGKPKMALPLRLSKSLTETHLAIIFSSSKNDLSRQPLDDFFQSMEEILTESKRVLKRNKYISILIGDLVYRSKFIPLTRKIANIAESIGLEDCGYAIKITYNSVSQIRRGKAIYAELANTKNLKINHDDVLFWKKSY